VHVMPRYVLHNLLDVPLQCKQAGTAVERELTPGVRSSSLGHALLHDMSYNTCTSANLQARQTHILHLTSHGDTQMLVCCRFLPLCTGQT
jgi:hypothetical protein